jgi:CDP-diacylglycerol---serine O-phosphatidyltransferase
VGLPIPVAGGLIAAIIHFAPLPLVYYGPERSKIYSLLLMALMGLLGVLMVSTLRFPSFKTVGTSSRSMRTIILAVAIGALILLYSRQVLLIIVIGYIMHGLLSRIFQMFRRRSEVAETTVQTN